MIDAYCHLDMSAEQPIADLERRMDAAGIIGALIVETWSGDNRGCLRQIMVSGGTRFRLAPCFRPEEKRSDDELIELVSKEAVRAVRVKTADLRLPGPLAAMLESTGKWLLPHAESGIGALTDELVRLAVEHPKLFIYLPHLGWPRRGEEEDRDWRESMEKLSGLAHVIVGISAIAHFSREAFPHLDVAPFASELLAAFGAESLVAASDYPLFEKERYAEYMQLARAWVGGSQEGARRAELDLFGK